MPKISYLFFVCLCFSSCEKEFPYPKSKHDNEYKYYFELKCETVDETHVRFDASVRPVEAYKSDLDENYNINTYCRLTLFYNQKSHTFRSIYDGSGKFKLNPDSVFAVNTNEKIGYRLEIDKDTITGEFIPTPAIKATNQSFSYTKEGNNYVVRHFLSEDFGQFDFFFIQSYVKGNLVSGVGNPAKGIDLEANSNITSYLMFADFCIPYPCNHYPTKDTLTFNLIKYKKEDYNNLFLRNFAGSPRPYSQNFTFKYPDKKIYGTVFKYANTSIQIQEPEDLSESLLKLQLQDKNGNDLLKDGYDVQSVILCTGDTAQYQHREIGAIRLKKSGYDLSLTINGVGNTLYLCSYELEKYKTSEQEYFFKINLRSINNSDLKGISPKFTLKKTKSLLMIFDR